MTNKQLDEVDEKVLDRIDAWHESSVPITLAAYLGWSDEEYYAYVEGNKIPEREYE
tara:strand:- start:1255 stop:1422 length:168 start_codon:yes stop_codon:yes gene_type:complete